MYLIVGSTPASDWERVLPLLTRAGCAVPAMVGSSLEQACAELLGNPVAAPTVLATGDNAAAQHLDLAEKEFAAARLLLFHSRPEPALVQAMDDNREPREALEKWQQAAEQLLQVHKHNRKRTSLIDIDCALAAPELFMRACHDHLGLKKTSPPNDHQPTGENTDSNDLHHLIAAQMVAQSPRIGELIAELEASSLPLAEPTPPTVDCEKIYQDYRNLKQQLEEENELLLLQLHQVQEELESYYLQLQSEQKKHRQAKTELAALKKDKKTLQKDLKSQKARYDRVKKSTSWKITSPLRKAVKLLKPARKTSS